MSTATSHTVVSGETLGQIAMRYKKTVPDLVDINHLHNPNQLEIGQLIYLEKHEANAVQVMFMDKLRYPIEGLKAMLKFDGKAEKFTSNASGLVPPISTESIGSMVEVWVQNANEEWSKVGEALSGLGPQWLNLISPGLKFQIASQQHDDKAAQEPVKPANSKDKPHDGKTGGKPIKPGHAATLRPATSHNTVVLEVDVPQDLMDYFKLYEGGDIPEHAWEVGATSLGCEPEVLKAISTVESGGRDSFWRLNKVDGIFIPALLFERHKFSKWTQHRYDKQDPDISWPVGYQSRKTLGMSNKEVQDFLHDKTIHAYAHGDRVNPDDVYSDNASAYLRLLKAYRLDKDAALKSASWGKFQILGENFAECGVTNPYEFVMQMCKGESGQLQLLLTFIGSKSELKKSVQTKDWVGIAYNYNGPDYKKYHYDTLIANAYLHHKNRKGNL